MSLHERIERAKALAVLGAKTLGVAGTVAALGILWVLLHEAESEWLEAVAEADTD